MGKPCRYLKGDYSRQKEKEAQRPPVKAYLASVRNGREAVLLEEREESSR